MAGNKVEISAAKLRRRHGHHPGLQVAVATGQQGIDEQRRQGEIVNEVRFVAVTEVTQVFLVGDVGFGHHHRLIVAVFEQQAHHADKFVGFGEVHAAGANGFPQKANGVKAEERDPVIEVALNDAHALDQNFRVLEIEIHLVGAKGGPHVLETVCGFHRGKRSELRGRMT